MSRPGNRRGIYKTEDDPGSDIDDNVSGNTKKEKTKKSAHFSIYTCSY